MVLMKGAPPPLERQTFLKGIHMEIIKKRQNVNDGEINISLLLEQIFSSKDTRDL